MRQIVLLRGINLGPHNRVSMPALRELLTAAGFDDVATYLQSGNVVLSSDAPPKRLARECERLVAQHFGVEVSVLVRTRDELAEVVQRNPLGKVATNPKRYQVAFLSGPLKESAVDKLAELAAPSERVVVLEREIYAWHPEGIARSRFWSRIASQSLGVTATARNWTTVTNLLAMASE